MKTKISFQFSEMFLGFVNMPDMTVFKVNVLLLPTTVAGVVHEKNI